MHDEMIEEEILEEFSKFPNLDLWSKINARLRLWNLKSTKQINYVDYERSLNIKIKGKILKRYVYKIHCCLNITYDNITD